MGISHKDIKECGAESGSPVAGTVTKIPPIRNELLEGEEREEGEVNSINSFT